jgi:hypothetical protein
MKRRVCIITFSVTSTVIPNAAKPDLSLAPRMNPGACEPVPVIIRTFDTAEC